MKRRYPWKNEIKQGVEFYLNTSINVHVQCTLKSMHIYTCLDKNDVTCA